MARKQRKVCDHILDLNVGDVLVWDNTAGTRECVVTKCTPALEHPSYTIPAHGTKDANVVHISDQTYHGDC